MLRSVVNAPMVAPEVLKELQPFVNLAEGLGRTAVQLVEESGFADVSITYSRCAAVLLLIVSVLAWCIRMGDKVWRCSWWRRAALLMWPSTTAGERQLSWSL